MMKRKAGNSTVRELNNPLFIPLKLGSAFFKFLKGFGKAKEAEEPIVKRNRMSRDFLNSLPIIKFCGNISVIEDMETAEHVLDYLGNEKELGFDTENRPSFKKGISYPISLIQLSTLSEAFLFQVGKMGVPKKMVSILENRDIRKIGIGVDADKKKLAELVPIKPQGFVDLKTIAEKKGIIQTGARALTARYLGHRITKGAQRSNWAQPVLSEKQIKYAATDAWICLKIYPLLAADNYTYIDEDKLQKQSN